MKQTTSFNCPVEATLSLIGGKYKPLILWHLINHPLHYMELQRLIPSATPKMLSQQLRDLENSGSFAERSFQKSHRELFNSLTAFGEVLFLFWSRCVIGERVIWMDWTYRLLVVQATKESPFFLTVSIYYPPGSFPPGLSILFQYLESLDTLKQCTYQFLIQIFIKSAIHNRILN